MEPEIMRYGILDMSVCVPAGWTDEQVIAFAESSGYPCGTTGGWFIRQQGDKYLAGCDERVPCAKRPGFVHIMLDA